MRWLAVRVAVGGRSVHGFRPGDGAAHGGEDPLNEDRAQQFLGGERLPRVELDLAAIDQTATRPSHGHLASAEHDLTGRRAVPVPDPPGADLGVLRTNDRRELDLQSSGAHHDQPGRCANASRPSRIAADTLNIPHRGGHGSCDEQLRREGLLEL
jgi:hypothetical protein